MAPVSERIAAAFARRPGSHVTGFEFA
jgi:hypothetical protein